MTLRKDSSHIETNRLLLRRISRNDLPFFARIHADAEVARFLSHGQPRSVAESTEWLEAILDSYQSLCLGQLAVVRKSDGALVGRCGLSDLVVESKHDTAARCWWLRGDVPQGVDVAHEYELGYTFDRAQWGNGYAREAVRCVCDYAKEVLGLSRMVSLIHPENARSINVARHFGAQQQGQLQYMERLFDKFVWPQTVAP